MEFSEISGFSIKFWRKSSIFCSTSCYTMETLKKLLRDLIFRRKNEVHLWIGRKNIEKIPNINVEAKFACGSNRSTLGLWKSLPDLAWKKIFFPLALEIGVPTFWDYSIVSLYWFLYNISLQWILWWFFRIFVMCLCLGNIKNIISGNSAWNVMHKRT